MGNSQTLPFKDYLEDFNIVSVNQETNTTYLKKRTDNKQYILQQTIYNDKKLLSKSLHQFQTRLKFKSEHLANLQKSEHVQKDHLCSTVYQIFSLWEHPFKTLQQQIKERITQKRKFTEKQLLSIGASCILGLTQLQKYSIFHQHLNSANIYLAEDGTVKVADPLVVQNSTNFDRIKDKHENQNYLYLSPQQCSALQSHAHCMKSFKNDVWCLGMILMESAMLETQQKCYRDEYQKINLVKIDKNLSQIEGDYGKELKNMIKYMLAKNKKDRPDWEQLQAYIMRPKSERSNNHQNLQMPPEPKQNNVEVAEQKLHSHLPTSFQHAQPVQEQFPKNKSENMKFYPTQNRPQFQINRPFPTSNQNAVVIQKSNIQYHHPPKNEVIHNTYSNYQEKTLPLSHKPQMQSQYHFQQINPQIQHQSQPQIHFQKQHQTQPQPQFLGQQQPQYLKPNLPVLNKPNIQTQPYKFMKEQKKVETKKNDNTLFSAGYQEVKPTEFPKKQKQQLDKDILKKFVPPSSSSQEYLFTKPDFLIPIVESQNLMQLRTQKDKQKEKQVFLQKQKAQNVGTYTKLNSQRHTQNKEISAQKKQKYSIVGEVKNTESITYEIQHQFAKQLSNFKLLNTQNQNKVKNANTNTNTNTNVNTSANINANTSAYKNMHTNKIQQNELKLQEPKDNSIIVKQSILQIQQNNENQPNFVIQEFKQGSRYEGYKVNEKRHGKGRFYYQDGGMYDGNWVQNRMEGFGTLYYDSGKVAYKGQWKNDQFNGKGKLYNEESKQLSTFFDYCCFDDVDEFWQFYEGEFIEDLKEGRGKFMLSNGQYYLGTFENDCINGEGKYYRKNGSVVKGVWKDNNLVSQYS